MTQLATEVFGEHLNIPTRKKGGKPRDISGSQTVESNEPQRGQIFQKVLFRNCGHGNWCAHLDDYRGRKDIELVVMKPGRRLLDEGEYLNIEVDYSIGGSRHGRPFMWAVKLLGPGAG